MGQRLIKKWRYLSAVVVRIVIIVTKITKRSIPPIPLFVVIMLHFIPFVVPPFVAIAASVFDIMIVIDVPFIHIVVLYFTTFVVSPVVAFKAIVVCIRIVIISFVIICSEVSPVIIICIVIRKLTFFWYH